jgi:hypothetical protein
MKKSNLSKTLGITGLAMLPLASFVHAEVASVSVGFTTLPEITIAEQQQMSFGSVLSLTPADDCTMTVNSTNKVAASLDKSSLAGTGSPGALTGDCVTTTDGTPGVYYITAIQGSNVQVTLTGSTNTDISFAPAGYVVDFDNDSNAGDTDSDDEAKTIDDDVNNDVAVYAPTTGEFSATVSPGVIGLVLGGEIVNQQALLADTPVTATFDVEVIYN